MNRAEEIASLRQLIANTPDDPWAKPMLKQRLDELLRRRVEVKPIKGCGSAMHVIGPKEWGIVEYAGPSANKEKDWAARLAVYQKKASHGPLKRPRSQQRPRYRTLGYFPTKEKAIEVLTNHVK